MFLIILLHAMYGCTFTISKILIYHAKPVFVIGIRMTLAGIMLSTYAMLFCRKDESVFASRKTTWYILQIAFFGTFIPYVLRYWSLQFLTVTKTALIYNIAPFVSFFFSFLFFNEKATVRKWLGLVIGFSGIIPILIAKGSPGEGMSISFWFLSVPEIAMIIAVTCFSYGWIVMKKLVLHTNLSPARINGSNMFMAGLMALSTSFLIEPTHHISNLPVFTAWLLAIIAITNFFCYNLYALLLKKHSATLLSLAGLIAPVTAAITSWIYFGEVLTWDSYATGILVMIGFILFYSDELRQKRADKNKFQQPA